MKVAVFLGLICAVSLAGGLAQAKMIVPSHQDVTVGNNIMKTKHDTAKNAIGNIR